MNATTCDPSCCSHSNSKDHLYVLIVAIINAVLSLVVPYMIKTRPVQNVLHPHRVEKRKQLRQSIETCIASMTDVAKALSERSSESSASPRTPKIDSMI